MSIPKLRLKTVVAAAFSGLLLSTIGAVAQQATTVNFTIAADMPTIKDASKQDHFVATATDAQITTSFDLVCTAGHTDLLIVRKDKTCSFQNGSAGSVHNPKTNQQLPRTQYLGSYSVTADGTTDAKTLAVNYLTLGTVQASNAQFGGSLNLKPELTSSGAAALKDAVLAKLGQGPDGLTNPAIDTIDFNRFFVPSAGLPSDKGVTWNGNMVYAYQTASWFIDVSADFNGKTYAFKGNMPFTDTPGSTDGGTQYDLIMTLPSDAAAGDDALFADAGGGDGDLFAAADGISGQILMSNSNIVDAVIDGETVPTATRVDGTGSFTGTNVPVEVVRSFTTIVALLGSTFFGA
jgi:hypothetical protein